MNEQQIAQAALQFMERVQLQGAEVPAFTIVSNWLREHAQPASPPPNAEPA